jgi:uncharacterized protein YbjT (DUF2867 family)
MPRTLLIAGATGLVGHTTLRLALNSPRFDRVVVLARRPTGEDHPKLEEWCAEELLTALRHKPVDAVICCLGTTIRKVGGEKAKFIQVDKDLVVGLGRWAREQQVPVMCVVSAIGADPASRVFYNRVKGEMEAELKALDLPVLHLFQPSILTGPRKEVRLGERIGIFFGSLLTPLLPERYRPMPHDILALALLHAVEVSPGGTHTTLGILALARAQRAAKGS